MRILFLNYEYPPCGGGGGATTKFLAEALVDRGHQVHVLTSGTKELLGIDDSYPGLTVERIDSGRKRADSCTASEMLRYVVGGTLRFSRLRRDFRPDLVHCFFGMPTGAILYLSGTKHCRPYYVSLLGGDVPGFLPDETTLLHRLTRRATRAVWRDAAQVQPNSLGLADLARQTLQREYEVISNGVDLGRFSASGAIESAGPLRLLFVGRLVPQKGLDVLIAALGKISARGLHLSLTIIGDGPDRSQLEAAASRLPSSMEVIWLGWVPLDALPRHYRENHALVMPSRFEGMASVMLQAMASGCTIVTTDVFGANDVVASGVNGFIVPVDDAATMAARIVDLMEPGVLDAMRTAAAETGRARSWDVLAARMEHSYGDAVRRAATQDLPGPPTL